MDKIIHFVGGREERESDLKIQTSKINHYSL